MLSPAPRPAPAPARMEGGTYFPVEEPTGGKSAVEAGALSSPSGGVSRIIMFRTKIRKYEIGGRCVKTHLRHQASPRYLYKDISK